MWWLWKRSLERFLSNTIQRSHSVWQSHQPSSFIPNGILWDTSARLIYGVVQQCRGGIRRYGEIGEETITGEGWAYSLNQTGPEQLAEKWTTSCDKWTNCLQQSIRQWSSPLQQNLCWFEQLLHSLNHRWNKNSKNKLFVRQISLQTFTEIWWSMQLFCSIDLDAVALCICV